MAASDQVRELYGLARTAVVSRDRMREALKIGQVQSYHRVLREHPEVGIAEGLQSARKLVGELSSERTKVSRNRSLPGVRRDMELQQIEEAIAQVATGTLLWAKEYMAGFRMEE